MAIIISSLKKSFLSTLGLKVVLNQFGIYSFMVGNLKIKIPLWNYSRIYFDGSLFQTVPKYIASYISNHSSWLKYCKPIIIRIVGPMRPVLVLWRGRLRNCW